jgi:hypothetical protein
VKGTLEVKCRGEFDPIHGTRRYAAPDAATITLVEALAAIAEPGIWQRYSLLAAALEQPAAGRAAPVYAVGSVEWQRQREEPATANPPLSAECDAAGRRRLATRGTAAPFAGGVSPLGAAGGAAFDDFVSSRRGPAGLLAEIKAVEERLVDAFKAAGRAGRYRASGFRDGARQDIEADWFGQVQLDFARDRVVLPDGSAIAGVAVTMVPGAAGGSKPGERPARAMLRQALLALWQRGAFTAGTGNERVLALALRELGLSAADPPYGLKSAETVRRLRKALGMSL